MKKGSIQKFSPLHKEIFRASFSGYTGYEIMKLMGVSSGTVHYAKSKAQKLVDNGQFEEYAEILPGEDWSLMTRDPKTGEFSRAFDDSTQMSPQDLKHIKRNEIDQGSSYVANDVQNSEYASNIVKRSKLNNREIDMTLKHRTEDMTFKQIASGYGVSGARAQQIVEKTHRKLREGMAGDVNTHLRENNTEATKLQNEKRQLEKRRAELWKLVRGVDEERELLRIYKRLGEIRNPLDSAMDKVRQTLIEH
jgi:hypothetical protein